MAEARHALLTAPGPRRAALALPPAALVAILAWTQPQALAAGALAAWIAALSATTGAALWLLIERLTGGVWIRAGEATLAALAQATPAVALLGIPLFFAGPLLYPWWDGYEGLKGAIWLVPWSFALRGAAILALWALIGWIAPRRPPPVAAALLLVLYGISVGIAGLDWILSRDPHMLSTAFGMLLAATQLGLALAVAAARGLDPGTPRAVADWGGLLLACVLGSFYLAAMQFLVSWSGNLPAKAAWFAARTDGIGTGVIVVALLAGVVYPFAVLIQTPRRGAVRDLRAVGLAVAVGGVLHLVWLCVPGGMHVALLGTAAVLAVLWALGAPLLLRRTGHG